MDNLYYISEWNKIKKTYKVLTWQNIKIIAKIDKGYLMCFVSQKYLKKETLWMKYVRQNL